MTRHSFPLLACGIVLSLGLWECSVPPLRYHSDIGLLKQQGSSIAILTDVDIIDDIGDVSAVDVSENKSFGGMMLNYFEEHLEARHYNVSNLILTSVGLMMDRHQQYRLTSNSQLSLIDVDNVPLATSPFYINEMFNSDSEIVEELFSTYHSLITEPAETLNQRKLLPQSAAIGKRLEAKTLLFIVVGGHSVSLTKQLTDESAVSSSKVGTISMAHITQLSVTLFIIDAATGEFLWSDQAVSHGGNINSNKLLHLADQLIDEIP